jgi:hypothetical protein
MAKINKLAKALVLGLACGAGASMAASEIGGSDLDKTVAEQLRHDPAITVARDHLLKKVDVSLLAGALVHGGVAPCPAVAAVIGAGGDAGAATAGAVVASGATSAKDVVVCALKVSPDKSAEIIGAAVAAGADPATLPATGAGPTGAGGAAGFGGAGGAGPTFNAPSYGGGGGGSVSRS